MSTRIKELEKLATEAEHSHGAFGEHETHYRLNTEKFAKLIILSCIDEAFMNGDNIDYLKEYFGVEK